MSVECQTFYHIYHLAVKERSQWVIFLRCEIIELTKSIVLSLQNLLFRFILEKMNFEI